MAEDYLSMYQMITQHSQTPDYQYTTPEEQGAAIQKCSILEVTNIEYSNETRLSQKDI